jgi:hypothetical protein
MSNEPKDVQSERPMSIFKRRYVFTFEASHAPSRTKAKIEIPADSEFEAEAILTRLLEDPKRGLTGYWMVDDATVFDTAAEEITKSMANFDPEVEFGSPKL